MTNFYLKTHALGELKKLKINLEVVQNRCMYLVLICYIMSCEGENFKLKSKVAKMVNFRKLVFCDVQCLVRIDNSQIFRFLCSQKTYVYLQPKVGIRKTKRLRFLFFSLFLLSKVHKVQEKVLSYNIDFISNSCSFSGSWSHLFGQHCTQNYGNYVRKSVWKLLCSCLFIGNGRLFFVVQLVPGVRVSRYVSTAIWLIYCSVVLRVEDNFQ